MTAKPMDEPDDAEAEEANDGEFVEYFENCAADRLMVRTILLVLKDRKQDCDRNMRCQKLVDEMYAAAILRMTRIFEADLPKRSELEHGC